MYYHCSPSQGLTLLQPGKPKHFDKDARVYMTTSLPMALMYGVRNFEYTYGYTKSGQIYFEEYYPDALQKLYAGKKASLYECAPEVTETTPIPNEVVSSLPVRILRGIHIPDMMQALLEQQRQGALIIRRYEQLSPAMKEWIFRAELQEVNKRNLLHTPGPMADYMKHCYPDVWAAAEAKEKYTPEG